MRIILYCVYISVHFAGVDKTYYFSIKLIYKWIVHEYMIINKYNASRVYNSLLCIFLASKNTRENKIAHKVVKMIQIESIDVQK